MGAKLKSCLLLNAVALAISTPCFAYEAGDILVRVGAATVSPEDKSEDIQQVAGSQVSADNNTQLGISGTYMFSAQFGLELLAASPFSHEISAKGGSLEGAKVGEVNHLPPTLSAQYYFMGADSAFQPYVGLGINYTVFFDEDTASDVEGLGYDELSLDSSVGLAIQVGGDFQISELMFLNASLMYAQIGTEATLKSSSNTAAELNVDYDLDPLVFRLSAGFKF